MQGYNVTGTQYKIYCIGYHFDTHTIIIFSDCSYLYKYTYSIICTRSVMSKTIFYKRIYRLIRVSDCTYLQ